MSRVAKQPVVIPKGVEITLSGQRLSVKGGQGSLDLQIHASVEAKQDDDALHFRPRGTSKSDMAMAGTMRAIANNMVVGVSQGFEKKLQLVGVGYRAQAQGRQLNLTLGYSHPIVFQVPETILVETPSQTEILVKGSDRQKVGQVAAEIRGFRSPEPYKGKGVRYADEQIVIKEAKKK